MQLRKLISIFLILVISFGFITKGIVLLNYSIHNSEYIKQYCVNINSPEKNCCGKCYLTQELSVFESSKSNETLPTNFLNYEVSIFIVQMFTYSNFILNKNLFLERVSYYNKALLNGYSQSIFKPPIPNYY